MPDQLPAFETIPLDRGVTLHFRRSDGFKTDLARVFIRAPLDGRRTLRRLYAAVLARSTSVLPDRRVLAARLQELYGAGYGVMVQRLAGRSVLAFRASTVAGRFLPGKPRNLEQLLALLAGALEGPPVADDGVEPEIFEQERRALLREYAARMNNKARYAAQRLQEEMFGEHPLGHPDTGRERDILEATPQSCLAEGRRTIREGEIDVYLLARVTASRAERLVAKAFAFAPRAPERFRLDDLRSPRRRWRAVRESMDVQQAKLLAGFRLEGWRCGEARYIAALADAILGSGPSSKLFRNVRERRSLCYDVRSHLDPISGALTIGAGIDPPSYDAALEAIRAEVGALAEGRISEEEVRVARAGLLNALEEVSDTQSGMVDFFYVRRLLGRPEQSLAEVAQGVSGAREEHIPELMGRARLDTVFLLDSENPKAERHGAA